MDVYEICGNVTGLSDQGVNFLNPSDSYQVLQNGYIYRQKLFSRAGVAPFTPRLADESRITGIFEHILPDGTKNSLATDRNFLYKYNDTTGVYDQIPFGGSMAGYAGFNIVNNEDYTSGVSYPTATNTQRFVFTGRGIAANGAGSAVFFFDGTDVLDYTDVGDNPDYEAPSMGALIRSTYLLSFNQRLNFVVPVIVATKYSQGLLYSGIRDSGGNGDKYNVPTSGLLQLDTAQSITGASILGQIVTLNVTRSSWTLEKTRDAFNPYFQREVPGVVGTDATFSAVVWNEAVKSLGKPGAVSTDGRRNVRFDNKVPFLTSDEIDQGDFDLTYGGFDRIIGQFLWAYKISETDTDTQNGVLVYNYEEGTWATFDERFSCFGQTDLGLNLAWDAIDETSGNESWASWDTTEEIWDKIGLGAAVQKTLAGDNLGFIYDINSDFNDYYADISAITNANSAVLTVSPSAIQVGDRVTISGVTGMDDINNFDPSGENFNYEPYNVLAATDTSITIDYDSSISPNYISGGAITKVISFYAKTIPFNFYRDQGCKIYVSHVDFLIANNGGQLKVDVFADQQQTPFKSSIICAVPQGSTEETALISMSVNQEANFITFALKQESPSAQLQISSMKIYCEPGAMTNG